MFSILSLDLTVPKVVSFTVIRQLEVAFNGLLASRYLTASAAVVLIYDHIITLSDEIELVWSSPLSVASVMFYINRYMPAPIMLFGVFHLSPFHGPQSIQFCRAVLLVQPIGETISYMAASWILMLRVIALYRRSRVLAFLLYSVFAVTHIVALSLSGHVMFNTWASLQYSSLFGVCVSNNAIRQFSLVYFALLPLEIFLISLQLVHLVAHRHVMSLSGTAQPSILKLIYLDGSIYFIIVFGLRLWAGAIYAFGDVSLFYIATWTEFAFGAATISRLFLRLRRTARLLDYDSGTTLSTTDPFSTGIGIINFTAPFSLSSQSIPRRERDRATSLSTILSADSFWTKDVDDVDNDDTSGHVNLQAPQPFVRSSRPLHSNLLMFIKPGKPTHVRSATF